MNMGIAGFFKRQKYFFAGCKRMGAGDLEGAIAAFTRAIELGERMAYPSRAAAYRDSKNYALALADFEEALKVDEFNGHGSAVFEDELKDLFQKSHAASGETPGPQDINLSLVEFYTKLIEQGCTFRCYDRGLVYMELGKYGPAAADFQAALDYYEERTEVEPEGLPEALEKAKAALAGT
jgi:tetratricopeptide (TPR) repeat protein